MSSVGFLLLWWVLSWEYRKISQQRELDNSHVNGKRLDHSQNPPANIVFCNSCYQLLDSIRQHQQRHSMVLLCLITKLWSRISFVFHILRQCEMGHIIRILQDCISTLRFRPTLERDLPVVTCRVQWIVRRRCRAAEAKESLPQARLGRRRVSLRLWRRTSAIQARAWYCVNLERIEFCCLGMVEMFRYQFAFFQNIFVVFHHARKTTNP